MSRELYDANRNAGTKEPLNEVVYTLKRTDVPKAAEGNIKIRVQAENAKMTLALRIPGWCKNYKISGIEDAAQEEKDGYLYLKKVWNREENFCIDFPMEVQMFAASERVREDIGKAAIMRGPVVYCLEEKDNGKNLHELLVDTDIHASVSEGKICDTVVKMVETDGWRLTESGDAEETLYHMYQKPQKQKVRLHYIPYYTWANHILFPLLHFPSIPKHTHSPLFHFHSGANHTLSPPSCFLSVANYILSPPPHTTISTLHIRIKNFHILFSAANSPHFLPHFITLKKNKACCKKYKAHILK